MLDKSFADLRMDQTRLPRDATAVTATQAQALKDGEVLADDGASYATVQAAQDAASSWIRLPPETFNEAVTVDTAGLTVIGSGYDTLIDGQNNGIAISVTADDVTVKYLSLRTESSVNDSPYYPALQTGSVSGFFGMNIVVREAEQYGFEFNSGSQHTIVGCSALGPQNATGAQVKVGKCKVLNCHFANFASSGINFQSADDGIIAGNIVDSVDSNGIRFNANDVICYANRVHNAGDDGIKIAGGTDSICVNNRVSDSTNTNIADGGTNTLKRDNVTGPAN